MPQFPDALETIQVARQEFIHFAARAKAEGIGYLGGCCGCNAAYIKATARGLAAPVAELKVGKAV
jgi:betaine-homocysteine S-methyltransferase